MKHLLLSLAAVAAFLPAAAGATSYSNIVDADSLTNTTQRYVAGELEQHLETIGTDNFTGRKMPAWRWTQEGGVRLHCARTLRTLNKPINEKCGGTTNVRSVKAL